MSDNLNLDLDPKKVLKGMQDISAEAKKLAEILEKSLGKDVPDSLGKTEHETEKTAGKIAATFRNLGHVVKEGLKTSFNLGAVMQGLNMGKYIAEGTKQVFEMEKAFDRINTRLGLTGKQLTEFRNTVGRAAAGAGRGVEEILPGVEVMAAKGGVEGPQLGLIADVLAKAATASGEESGALADTVIEILKTQGRKVNAENVKNMVDALQASRVQGAFLTATEAGMSMKGITQGLTKDQMEKLGLGDEQGARKLAGLAAMASRGGEQGTAVLQSMLHQAAQPGGKARLNAVLGAQIFDDKGQIDVNKFKDIDKNKWGEYTAQVRGGAANVDQASLDRFISSMQENTAAYQRVVDGNNENVKQFNVASDNLATTFDKFVEGTKEGARELGAGLSGATRAIMKGDFKRAYEAYQEGKAGAKEYGAELATGVTTAGVSAAATGMGLNALGASVLGGGTAAGAGGAALTAGGALTMAGGGMILAGGAATSYGVNKAAEAYPEAGFAYAASQANVPVMVTALTALFEKYFGDKKAVQYTNPSDISGNRGGGQ